METGDSQDWKEVFARAATDRRAHAHRRRDELERERKDREARKDRENDAGDETGVIAIVALLATQDQVTEFTGQLDEMDAALVEALTDNSEALRQARARLEEILSRAYRLPDGRAVFLTEDGLRVIAESGEDVTDIIAPDEIDPGTPTWEDYTSARDEDAALEAEREALLDYQERIDEARERVAAGDMTVEELEDLQAQLEEELPEAVRARLDGWDPSDTPEPAGPAAVNLDALRAGLTGATAGL